MATSGALSTSNQYIKYKITITQNSQSITNNTSNVTVSVKFYRTNTGYTTYGSGTVYCKINGTTYSASVDSADKITSSGITLFTKTLNISHASDGTKTLSTSAWISHSQFSASEQSYSMKLTTIPRKSTLSVGNGTLGTAQTLTVTRQSSSFTHTIIATCGSASTTIATKSTSTSISFTPPIAWSSQNTTGTSVSVKYTITTYNGSTSVGSNSYTKTCSIPSSVKPSCSLTVSDPTGYLSTYGGYVQGLSKFTVSVSASGSYSSSIKSYRTTANGGTYTASSFTTGVITSSGTLTISTTVTDSRSRTASASKTATVLAYAAPRLSSFSVVRCNQDGTVNSGGSYMKATFSSSVTSLSSKNKATYVLKYKKSTDSSYTSVTLSNYANNYAVSGGSYIFAADTASSYNVTLTLSDNFRSVSVSGSGTTASKTVSLYNQGKGIAFGKVAEKADLLDSAYRMIVPNHSAGVSWVSGMAGDNASLQISTQQSTAGYHPYMYVKTNAGHVVNIGGYINDFGIYGYYYGRTNNGTDWMTKWNSATGGLYHNKAMTVDGAVTVNGGLYFPNNGIIYGKNTSGTVYEAMNVCSASNNTTIGYGGYANKIGGTYLYGNTTHIYAQTWSHLWSKTWCEAGLYTKNGEGYIYGRTTGGVDKSILGLSASDNVFLGHSPGTGTNNTNIYAGARINLVCQCGDSYPGQTLELYREQSSSYREILSPATNGTIYLGATSKRFNTAFFTNAITASDLKEKAVIEDYDFKAKDFIMNLKPIAYTRTGATDGGKRIHMGFGAQTVAKTIKDLDMGNLAMVQASIVYEDGVDEETGQTIIEEKPYTGEEIDDSELSWGINYTEIIPELVKHNQEQQKEIDSLKEEMQQLKEMVAKLVS